MPRRVAVAVLVNAALRLVAVPAGAQTPPPAVASAASGSDVSWAVSALVQVDGVLYDQASENELDPDTREPLNHRRLVLRRGRLAVEGHRGLVLGRLELDANTVDGPEVRPYEAYAGLEWPARSLRQDSEADERDTHAEGLAALPLYGRVAAGLMPVPFGFDATEPVRMRPYLESTTASQALFATGRDLGVGVELHYHFVSLATALMNGQPLGSSNDEAIDPTSHKDWSGRVGVNVRPWGPVRIEAGFSWLEGEGLYPGSAATKDTLVWSDGNENGQVELGELTSIPGSPARPAKPFDRFALGGDARLRIELPWLGALILGAEIVRAENLDRALEPADPIAAGRDLRELGWCARFSQEITQWFEAAARYDLYDPDADARRQEGVGVVRADRRRRTASFGLAVRGSGVRLIVQYDRRYNHLGLDTSGRPARLAADSLTLRAEAQLP